MDLKYKILWVDDVSGWVKANQRGIKAFLQQKHLQLEHTYFPSEDALMSAWEAGDIAPNKYDLLLIDYKLGAGSEKNGGKLIQKIRAREVFSQTIFYSQDGEESLRKELADLQLEGVYCVDRTTGFNGPHSKAYRIIENSIKKTQDLTFLRGFIMAQTSDLDHEIMTLLSKLSQNEKHDTSKHESKAFQRVAKHCKQTLNQLDKLHFSELIEKPYFDSKKKSGTLKDIVKSIDDISKHAEALADYYEKIIQPRNMLAHVKEEMRDGKIILTSHVSGYEDQEFNEELCTKLRSNILRYRKLLKALQSSQ